VRHVILTRSAYGPGWDIDANRRRLAMTRAVTIASLASQTSRDFRWLVLLHPSDPLLPERMAAFGSIGAEFLYLDASGTSAQVASMAYRAGWAEAIGPRNETIAMTRLDDDDGFAPWAMAKIQERARGISRRTVLLFPFGFRVWDGAYTGVRHGSNAMHTLVTPAGDRMTVYDYLHRQVRKVAPLRVVDPRPAWIWSRHPDTISGWRSADRPLTPEIRALFCIDWSIFGEARAHPRVSGAGRYFR
jgi:hypothetical protein